MKSVIASYKKSTKPSTSPRKRRGRCYGKWPAQPSSIKAPSTFILHGAPSAMNFQCEMRSTLTHEEKIEFVAIEIAEVSGIESLAARPGRALIRTAELQRLAMQTVDLGRAVDGKRHHHAVADGSRLLVERFRHAESRLFRLYRPGNELIIFHHSFRAQIREQRVVKGGRSRQIIRS